MLTTKLLKNLSEYQLDNHINLKEIDISIGGGGFSGFFVIGLHKILKKIQSTQRDFSVVRYCGTSVGAICCILMVCNVPHEKIITLYDNLRKVSDYFSNLRSEILKILPDDAYEQCSGKVFISITQLPYFNNLVISHFISNEDLVDACMASSCMPFFVTYNFPYRFRNRWCVDGFLSKNLILFQDSLRPQLIVKVHRIPYYYLHRFSPTDESIVGLIVKGAVEAEDVLCKNKSSTYLVWKKTKNPRLKMLSISMLVLSSSFLFLLSYGGSPTKVGVSTERT
jgi:predicted acylesterase/phospholipase RssA